jgi:hypothetical protein
MNQLIMVLNAFYLAKVLFSSPLVCLLNIFDIFSERRASNSLVVYDCRSHLVVVVVVVMMVVSRLHLFCTEVSIKALVDQALNMHKLFVEQ